MTTTRPTQRRPSGRAADFATQCDPGCGNETPQRPLALSVPRCVLVWRTSSLGGRAQARQDARDTFCHPRGLVIVDGDPQLRAAGSAGAAAKARGPHPRPRNLFRCCPSSRSVRSAARTGIAAAEVAGFGAACAQRLSKPSAVASASTQRITGPCARTVPGFVRRAAARSGTDPRRFGEPAAAARRIRVSTAASPSRWCAGGPPRGLRGCLVSLCGGTRLQGRGHLV